MRKRIVLSFNENPEYIFYVPIVTWAWKKLGWEAIIFWISDRFDLHKLVHMHCPSGTEFHKVEPIKGYHTDTIAQISRLYGACVTGHPQDYIMTGDIDMMPLSDYWKPDEKKITVWGHDLTGFGHFPICYIGMNRANWYKEMNTEYGMFQEHIKRDLDSLPQAKSADQVERWVTDQDHITQRMEHTKIEHIHRGVLPNGYPVGRVDRSAWTLSGAALGLTQDRPNYIDCHMLRGLASNTNNLALTMELLHKVWPEENFGWFAEYAWQFNKLENGRSN